MKIGIITQALLYNYGCILQNYALQTILKRNGHEVVTIDWDPLARNSKIKKLYEFIRSWILYKIGRTRHTLGQQKRRNAEQGIEITKFKDKYIAKTIPMKSAGAFFKYHQREAKDAYIVGSDQTWRPMYNPLLEQMFLQFTHNDAVKRIAYAASFGVDIWEYNDQQTKTCKQLVQKFDLVTVREKSGVFLCKDFFDKDAIPVLDPTLLLNKEDYIELIENECEAKSNGNLFYYIFNKTPEIISSIQIIGEQCGLMPFTINQEDNEGHDEFKKGAKFSSVTKWLKSFMDSELVIVDSFHGMVFSIIFNKNFWVIGNTRRGMARFESLLALLGLTERLIEESQLSQININNKIDWEKVNVRLEIERQRCIQLLNNYLS